MSVITISRGTFSGGLMLAECLAAKLGYRSIDRDVIVEKAAASGISQDVLRDALQKAPSFLDRFKHKKYVYLALIQAALSEEVQQGNVIYHGNAGHLLLKEAPVLRTRIIAPTEFRLKMAQERFQMNRAEALDHIHKMDNDRKKWTHYLYGVDWTDPSLYDIVLNLEHMGIQEACDIIAELATKDCFELKAESQAALDDLVLASRIRANLAINKFTDDLEVEVQARAGSVRIRGRLSHMDQFKEVERVAKAVPGVKELNLDRLGPSTGD